MFCKVFFYFFLTLDKNYPIAMFQLLVLGVIVVGVKSDVVLELRNEPPSCQEHGVAFFLVVGLNRLSVFAGV